jgi:transposase InsO family protein
VRACSEKLRAPLSRLPPLLHSVGATARSSSPGTCGRIVSVGAKTAFIEPGSPWKNGYCESFNSKLRDELLNGEIFYSLAEAKVIIESWRRD